MMLQLTPKKPDRRKIVTLIMNENVISVMLIAISFCVYLTTMCRSVGFTDSGELAAVVCTLGIAHPTGYPLFTLLGRCWTMLPFHLEEIIGLNILNVLFVALSVGIFFKITLLVNRAQGLFQWRNRNKKTLSDHSFVIASVLASLILGFSTTFWSQSAAIEVYSLHLVLLLLTIWMFVGGMEEQSNKRECISRKFILFAFLLGLSLSNHMTTILLAPAFLWLYYRAFGINKNSLQMILKLVPFFLLGISLYLYLPIRSSSYPLFDWGHPATSERLFWHVSGKQFRIWMFSSWDVCQKQLNYYLISFTSEFFIAILICIAAGIFRLFKRSKILLIFFIFLLVTTIAYSINYDIFDIGSYFLLSYIVFGWTVAYGIDSILEWKDAKQKWVRVSVILVIALLPIVQIINNFSKVDESKKNLPEQFVANTFSQLEPNAVVIASQWDYFISPSFYYQFIRNRRRDITIIDKSLLQNRSWYFLQIDHHTHWLMDKIRPSAELFLAELYKFEYDRPFDFSVIQARWQNLINDIVEQSMPDHPVYIDARLDREFSQNYKRTPYGLFLRLSKPAETVNYSTSIMHFNTWNNEHPVAKDFEKYYIQMLLYDAEWLLRQGKSQGAKVVFAEILRIEPGNYSAKWGLGQIIK